MCMGSPPRAPAHGSSIQQWPKKEQDRNKQTACSGCPSAPRVCAPQVPVGDGNRLGRAHVGELVRHVLVVAPHGGRFACTACRVSPATFSINTNTAHGTSAVRSAVSAHNQVCMHPAKLSGRAHAGKTAR